MSVRASKSHTIGSELSYPPKMRISEAFRATENSFDKFGMATKFFLRFFPSFFYLQIGVCINGKFLNRLNFITIIIDPTEHIDVFSEMTAAVITPCMVHILHLLPYVSIDVISMTV